MTPNEQDIVSDIAARVQGDLPGMPDNLQEWAMAHLCRPHPITLYLDDDRQCSGSFYLVTDHTGVHDSHLRVVYDPMVDAFGLTMRIANGTDWYLGPYGDFAETVDAM